MFVSTVLHVSTLNSTPVNLPVLWSQTTKCHNLVLTDQIIIQTGDYIMQADLCSVPHRLYARSQAQGSFLSCVASQWPELLPVLPCWRNCPACKTAIVSLWVFNEPNMHITYCIIFNYFLCTKSQENMKSEKHSTSFSASLDGDIKQYN